MSDHLSKKTIHEFLEELASSAPAPGGGSVAALSGALGAALISMVSNLTIGKKKYTDVQEDMVALREKSEALRQDLQDLIEADVAVFTRLSQAMKLPKETDEEKAIRKEEMDKALKAATDVPLQVAEACVAVMELCRPAGEKGNPHAVSDAGVAVLMAEAGLRSAALNVFINLAWIKDEAFIETRKSRLDALLADKSALRNDIYNFVVDKI